MTLAVDDHDKESPAWAPMTLSFPLIRRDIGQRACAFSYHNLGSAQDRSHYPPHPRTIVLHNSASPHRPTLSGALSTSFDASATNARNPSPAAPLRASRIILSAALSPLCPASAPSARLCPCLSEPRPRPRPLPPPRPSGRCAVLKMSCSCCLNSVCCDNSFAISSPSPIIRAAGAGTEVVGRVLVG